MAHKVSTGKGEWLFVEVPEGVTPYLVPESSGKPLLLLSWAGCDSIITLPDSYTFIGTTKDISEEQAGEIIDGGEYNGKYYRYAALGTLRPAALSAVYTCETKLESLRSLLIANKLNPELNYAVLKKSEVKPIAKPADIKIQDLNKPTNNIKNYSEKPPITNYNP